MSNRNFFFWCENVLGPLPFLLLIPSILGETNISSNPGGYLISKPCWSTQVSGLSGDIWNSPMNILPSKCSLCMNPLLTTFMGLEIEKTQVKAPRCSFFQLSVLTCLHLLPSFPWGEISSSGDHLCVPVPHLSCCVTINWTALRRAFPDIELKPSSLPHPSTGSLSALIFPWVPPGFRRPYLYPHPQVPSTAK